MSLGFLFGGDAKRCRFSASMNSKRNLLLLLVFAALLFYVRQSELGRDESQITEGLRLSSIPRKGFESVEVSNSHGTFSFKNPKPEVTADDSELGFDPSTWQVEGVKDSRLDPAVIGRLISNLKELRFTNPIPPNELESDLSVYGLKTPGIVVSVKGKDSKGIEQQFGVEIGGLNKYVSKRYARIVGEPAIYLVNDSIFAAANRKRDDYRLKNPITFTDNEVEHVSFVRPGLQFEFEPAGNLWKMSKPIQASASSTGVSELLRGFRELQASYYIDSPDEVAKLGLKSAPYKLAVKRKNQPDLVVLVGQKKSADSSLHAVFQIEGQEAAYESSSGIPNNLTVEVEKLREKRLFNYQWDRVKSAKFELPNDKFEIVKSEGGWKIGDKDADDVFVRELFRQWGTVEAIGFPAPTPSPKLLGFDQPAVKVTMTLDGVNEPIVFVIGKKFQIRSKSKGPKVFGYYAGRGDLQEPFEIDDEAAKRLFPKKEALLKPVTSAVEAAKE